MTGRKWIMTAACVALCFTLTACGGQKAAESTPAASGAGAEPQAESPQTKVELQELKIPGAESGTELYLRHKFTNGKTDYKGKEIVLFLEPYSVPTAQAFDVPGVSWMEAFAQKGYDTWALDFRGFGKSTWPEQMNKPAQENPPVIRADGAFQDLAAAVNYIKKARNADKISIVGWSWGAIVAGEYAAAHSDSIEKLVLYGAMHGFSLPSMAKLYEAPDKPGELNAKMPAYQVIDFDKGMHHWHMMLNGRNLVAPETMESVRQVFVASDPASTNNAEKAIRRPNGPLVDLHAVWSSQPLFDAAQITAPVLVIRGEDDFFADPGLINKLSGAAQKKEVVVKEATHWLLYEKHRDQLLSETDQFLRQ